MKKYRIPFNRPTMAGNEITYVHEAIQENWNLSGDGPFSARVHRFLEDTLGVKRAFLTPSCTDALEMTALLLNLKPGDEVIVPAFTFVSTANAFMLYGAKPVFCDIRSDTLNIDEQQLEKHITAKTKAIVVVHYAGIACEMDTILAIAKAHKLVVIEDNAHGLFGAYKGQQLGTLGDMATLSFHETKNFQCGEGGALLINNEGYIERAEIIRDKGTNRKAFFKGLVDKYTWVDIGSSFLMSDLSAAFLLAQLEQKTNIQTQRKILWERYLQGFSEWASQYHVQIPNVPKTSHPAYHLFYVILTLPEHQQMLINFLKKKDIYAVFHYQPLHLSPMGKQLGGKVGDCPRTEYVAPRLVRLPLHTGLRLDDVQEVIEAVTAFFNQ